jgi:hypothetical protein
MVISKVPELAGVAAAVLRGSKVGGYNPLISAAFSSSPERQSLFSIVGNQQQFNIEIAISHLLIDARRVNLWLALDTASMERARIYVLHNGPPPKNFYSGVFLDPVQFCGFDIPWMPKTTADLDDWLQLLSVNLQPWRERIWRAYTDSS